MLSALVALPVLSAPLWLAPEGRAQQAAPASLAPEATELGASTGALLMGPSCRIQQFYEVSELPAAAAGQVTVRALSLRFDGPTGSASVAHRIDELVVRLGATDRSVDELGAVFTDNLTRPLRTVYRAANYSYVTDARAVAGPEPWGGPDGQLRFALPAAEIVQIPPGGCLVVELMVRGNSNAQGADPAQLDSWVETAAVPQPGRAFPAGLGCWNERGEPTTLRTSGQYEPGTAFFVSGLGYSPGSPVVTLLTRDLLPSPAMLLGTPSCWLYVDPTTGGITKVLTADPLGGVGGAPGAVPVPRTPSLAGAKIYLQNVGVARVSAVNPAGLLTSNYDTIELGQTAPPRVRGWHVADPASSDTRVGSVSLAGGLALRLE